MDDLARADHQAIAELTEAERTLLALIGSGVPFGEAAATVGVERLRTWMRLKSHPAYQAAVAARYLPHAHKETAVIGVALDRALANDADGRAIDTGLKAAQMVQRGLGIAVSGASDAAAGARANVALTLTLDLAGVLRAPSPPALDVPRDARAWLDAPTARVEGNVPAAPALPAPPPGAVADAQPRRSRASSRRRVHER